MTQYILKSDVVAEIEKRISRNKERKEWEDIPEKRHQLIIEGQLLGELKHFLDSLEVKEVEEKFECPKIKIKDTIEVSSRMKHVDEDLKPIADFIIEYASWNLHKDEWNQPVLEVPLFRVLDALILRGKPYCEG